jgi:hypothetical protein
MIVSWQPTFLAFFCASRPWLFVPTLPNVISWVQEFIASEISAHFFEFNVARPAAWDRRPQRTTSALWQLEYRFLAWTYPWSAIEMRQSLSGTAKSAARHREMACLSQCFQICALSDDLPLVGFACKFSLDFQLKTPGPTFWSTTRFCSCLQHGRCPIQTIDYVSIQSSNTKFKLCVVLKYKNSLNFWKQKERWSWPVSEN